VDWEHGAPVIEEDRSISNSYIWVLIKNRDWVGVLDHISHALHFPKLIKNPICDAWDKHLGVTEDEMHRKK
jgi:hypothetical protein